MAEGVEQRRQELRETLTGPLTARGGIAAGLPSADRRDRLGGILKAEPLQSGKRGRLGGIARKHKRRYRQIGDFLEQSLVMSLDRRKRGKHRLGKPIGIGVPRQRRDAVKLRRIARDYMGLQIGDHLQPVLHPAQKKVGPREIVGGVARDPSAVGQSSQGFECATRAKFGVAPTGDELLGLGEELDIANAAAPEFDVMARHRDGVMPFERMYAPFHGVNVGDRRVVEIFPPNEGRELAQESLPRLEIAGDDARFDESGAFPVLAEALVIGEACVCGECNLRGARIGAKPQVGAEHVAVRRMLLH